VKLRATLFTLAVLSATAASAQESQPARSFNRLDALPSCYGFAQLPPPAAKVDRAFFVLVDQTTMLDASLKETVITSARHNVQQFGTEFAIGTFSAFLDNRYTDIALAGRLDALLTPDEIRKTNSSKKRRLDQCLKLQITNAPRMAMDALSQALGKASTEIARSDVLASLQSFADHVIAPSKAGHKTLLIASDMLENSSITTFYAKQAVRRLDPAAEMQLVREKGLVPNLSGVRVYVLGAGLLNTAATRDKAASYRDPQTMLALEKFWAAYFQEAKAQLVEFGKPQILSTVN
jgi:hypothetical protein